MQPAWSQDPPSEGPRLAACSAASVSGPEWPLARALRSYFALGFASDAAGQVHPRMWDSRDVEDGGLSLGPCSEARKSRRRKAGGLGGWGTSRRGRTGRGLGKRVLRLHLVRGVRPAGRRPMPERRRGPAVSRGWEPRRRKRGGTRRKLRSGRARRSRTVSTVSSRSIRREQLRVLPGLGAGRECPPGALRAVLRLARASGRFQGLTSGTGDGFGRAFAFPPRPRPVRCRGT